MENRRFGYILFDLDGVLIDSEPHHEHVRERLFAELAGGIPLGYDPTGMSTLDVYRTLRARAGRSDLPSAEALTRRHYDETLRSLSASGEPATPGLADTLAALKRAGAACAVVSSSERAFVAGVLAYLHISERFDFCVCAENVPHLKPAPDPYLLALKMCGAQIALTAAVEDSAAGVKAARAAGLFCFGLDRGQGQDLSGADMRISTLSALLPFIRS